MEKVLLLGTEIGANIHEASATTSRRQALAKMTSARSASSEIGYWLRLLSAAQVLSMDTIRPYLDEAHELHIAVGAVCIKLHQDLEKDKDV